MAYIEAHRDLANKYGSNWRAAKDYGGMLDLLFGPGGAEQYIRSISQQAGTQIGMATMPQYRQWQQQQAGGLAGRGGLGGGAQAWTLGMGQQARSGQMIGAVAGATGQAQRDVLSAKQQILMQLINAEIQRKIAEQQRSADIWGNVGQGAGTALAAIFGGG